MLLKFRYFILAVIVFTLIFSSCSTEHWVAVGSKYCLVKVDSSNAPTKDPAIENIIAPYKVMIDLKMDQILAISEQELTSNNPEGTLNDFIADVILSEANANYLKSSNEKIDLCLLNSGGLRTHLPKGNITYRNIFELMPFENELVVASMSGEVIKQICEYIALTDGQPVSGLKMVISNHHAQQILIQNQALEPTKMYRLVTSDYLYNGGDNMSFFKLSTKSEIIHLKVRDAIINYLLKFPKGEKIVVKTDNRIHYE